MTPSGDERPNDAAPALSRRGARAAASPLRLDHAAFREASRNRYHPTENPDGAIALSVAENKLCWPELRSKIEEITRTHEIPDWVPRYSTARGAYTFRTAAAAFLSEHLAGCTIEPDHLTVSAGATGTIEMTAFILADAGDVAVIPAPAYPVYRKDLGNLSAVQRHDLVTHHEIGEIARGPVLTVDDLERALAEVESSGRRFRMLVLTTPDNPTGGIYMPARLAELADWCIEHEVHMVVNEIYGLSLIDTTHPAIAEDYRDVEPFVSFARIMADRDSDWLHLWWAASKDLGISGFRTGLLHTRNTDAIRAYENLNLTHSVSNHTQWVLQLLLGDADFMSTYVALNRARLTDSYALAVTALKRLGIPYAPSRGSLFLWIDLSEFLADDSEAGELELWQEIFRESAVLFTPGVGFGHTKRGLFRVVYPAVARQELEVAMERLTLFVEAKRA